MSEIKAPPVHRAIAVQLGVTVLFAGIAALVFGAVSAYSFLFGGLISTIPNAYFAKKAFRHRGARAAGRVARDFYMGEAIKLAMICAGFSLAFVYIEPLDAVALFAGFILVHLSGLAALIRMQMTGILTGSKN